MDQSSEKKVNFGALDAVILLIVFVALWALAGMWIAIAATAIVTILIIKGVIKTHA